MPVALSGPAAIDAEHFARLLENFAPLADKIALAVSGGPDSMALAFCVKRWTKRDCVALIVDHGLRDESGAEAAQVKTRLEQIGLRAEILRWDHDPVRGRLHEKARTARYRLLTEACRRLGAGDLLVAHHREDQAETILMRLAKGSGIEGLAGISAQSVRDGVRILRPFLTLPKQDLLATCEATQIAFVADPSNMSEKFARGRLRKILPLLADEGLSVENLVALGARAAESADAIDHYARNLLREAALHDSGGTLRIARAALRDTPRAIAMRVLTLGLRFIHDSDYPPERAALAALLDAIRETQPAVRSLYGCLVSAGKNHVAILREPAAATESLPITPGETILWDNRWLVTLAEGEAGELRALGNPPHRTLDLLAPRLRHDVPQGRVRATLPALWRQDTLCAIPAFDATAAFRLALRKQTFP